MLSQLSVKNLAVVEALDLSFESGMSTVTGETGAGKSILHD
jgi:DNA repair protein RecN (Recombination protein N)